MPLVFVAKPLSACSVEEAGPRGSNEVKVERPADGELLLEPPNCTRSGLERGEWLAYYAAWIQKIDLALTKFAAVSLMGDSRGKFQEPTWLVEGIIQEERILWERPTPSLSLKGSRTRRVG